MDRVLFYFDFILCLVVGMNGMGGIGLVSRLDESMVVSKWRNVFVLSLYITTTLTITMMTEQMLGIIWLSYLPLLAVYEFLDYKQIVKAIIVNPFIYVVYYLIYEVPITIGEALYIVVTTYIALALLLYMFGKSTNSQRRLLLSAAFIGSFEVLNQVTWYDLTVPETVECIIVNACAYIVAIMIIDLLYLQLLKVDKLNYQEKYVDRLTNLYNYNAFNKDYQNELHDENYVMGVLDVDKFKKINDTHGHERGNEILELVANLISSYFDERYTMLTYKVYRYGGEEIVVVVKINDDENASEKMREVADLLIDINSKVARETEELFHERITFSAGITSYGLCGFNNKDTFIRADELLYKAKIDKNMVVMIDDTTK